VNKSGDIAGPRVLEHIVDVVLYMEVGTLNYLFWIVGKASTWLYCRL
jgi:predicted ATP-dependent serine protease